MSTQQQLTPEQHAARIGAAFRAASRFAAPQKRVPVKAVRAPQRDFTCYGGARLLWEAVEQGTPQCIIAGPAETGKTIAALHILDHYCWHYPNLQAVIVRAVHADMTASVLQTWENKVLRMTDGTAEGGVYKHGGESAQFYQYPNGSRVWVAGLDRPGKVLSSEKDMVFVNQAEELTVTAWETLSTRTTGRAGVLQPGILMGDANPAAGTHWIISKQQEGTLRLIESRHEDNPTLFDPTTGLITPQGIRSIAALDKLTGVLRKRLRLGQWASAEGVVYETWDASVHVKRELPPQIVIKYYVAGVDWGWQSPGVIQVWGVDGDKRMVRVREVYRSKRRNSWWVEEALKLRDEFGTRASEQDAMAGQDNLGAVDPVDATPHLVFVADPSRPDNIAEWRAAGLRVEEAFNSISLGVQNVEERLVVQEDALPRILYLQNAEAGYGCLDRDEELAAAHKPTCGEEEKELYVWPKASDGRALKEVPVDDNNHAQDTERYVAAYVDGLGNNQFFCSE